ncbi:MAG: DUF3256 family protein [Dysgonamonadaceae bacterium]|jgi:hypothetical protein|nr:DUF3256 family protein [Dysgonamonadaceae bacterium]
MKKTIIVIAALLVFPILRAQTAREAFVSLPESLLLDLDHNARLDLVDLYEAGRDAVLPNSFGDSVSIECLTPDYLRLKTGNNSFQLIVLQMINESRLYCTIHTVCAPLCDSRIEFYSVSGNVLDSGIFFTPAAPSWFLEEKEGFPVPDILLMQLDYDAETAVLSQTYPAPDNLSVEDRAKIQPSVRHGKKEYKWNGIRFEPLL